MQNVPNQNHTKQKVKWEKIKIKKLKSINSQYSQTQFTNLEN